VFGLVLESVDVDLIFFFAMAISPVAERRVTAFAFFLTFTLLLLGSGCVLKLMSQAYNSE
jgi:hypothetical protein